jgi:hypothetical protein
MALLHSRYGIWCASSVKRLHTKNARDLSREVAYREEMMASPNFARLCTGAPLRVAQRAKRCQANAMARIGMAAGTDIAVNDSRLRLAA